MLCLTASEHPSTTLNIERLFLEELVNSVFIYAGLTHVVCAATGAFFGAVSYYSCLLLQLSQLQAPLHLLATLSDPPSAFATSRKFVVLKSLVVAFIAATL